MPALTMPVHAHAPMLVLAGALAITLPMTLIGRDADPADANAVGATAHVRAAGVAPIGSDPRVDRDPVGPSVLRGERVAQPPAPTGRLAAEGAALLDGLGIAHSDPVTHDDLLAAAGALHVRTDGWVREEHLDAMQQGFLQRAKPAVVGLAVPTGPEVGPEQVRQAAATIGVDVGETVEPAEVLQVMRLAPDFPAGPTPRLGVVAGINVRVPSRVPLMAGFHQASYGNAIGIQPVDGPVSGVLPSRDRGTSMTSAIDVRVPPDTTVLAPIRGTVTEVTNYNLYGKYPDVKIRMVPESDPSLLVTILHVTDPLVGVGQVLEAGDPLAARGTQFPFESQIDRFAGRGPHVHIEARRR